ncbi:hypothetical protein Q7S_14105 [Rahnella aquatilis HX2]|nr:hypothetical protein Q7S_14105 [Rahnella aquatilis HX2]
MNLQELKAKLAPKLHKYEIEGFTINIHRPCGRDIEKCDSATNTIIICTKDENGDPIFANEDIDGRINVNSIDFTFQTQIYKAILELLNIDKSDEIEKK